MSSISLTERIDFVTRQNRLSNGHARLVDRIDG